MDLESGRPRQKVVQNSEDFRSLLNTKSSEKSECTIETTRLINSEVTAQVTIKLNKQKRDLNSQILDSINSATNERFLPVIQKTIGSQMTMLARNVDHRSGRQDRTADVRNSKNVWGIHPELDQNLSNQCNLSREGSIDSQRSEIDYDS